MKKSILVAVVLCAFFVKPLSAYDGPLHYFWTYYLALNAGFTERQAFQIASATYSLDYDESTGPLSFGATPPDGFLSVERARFYHPVINPLWRALLERVGRVQALAALPEEYTDLARLERTSRSDLGSILGPEWGEYVSRTAEVAPALRIWTWFHGFAPSGALDADSIDPFPFRIRNGGLDVWVKTYESDPSDPDVRKVRASMWETLDESVLEAYAAFLKACVVLPDRAVPTWDGCIERACTFEGLSCGPAPHDLRRVGDLFADKLDLRSSRPAEIDGVGIENPAVNYLLLMQRALVLRARLEDDGMDFGEVTRALSASLSRTLVELDPRRGGAPLSPRASTHGLFATAVRAESVRRLWDLAVLERNPGPLLHYIQDLPPHGDHDTFRGHAFDSHRPDFIATNPDFARQASEDSATLLCRFFDEIGGNRADYDIAPLQATVELPGEVSQVSFVWQPPDENSLCRTGAGSAMATRPARLAALRPGLETMAGANPSPPFSAVYVNAADILVGGIDSAKLRTPDLALGYPSSTRAKRAIQDVMRTNYYAPGTDNVRDIQTYWPRLRILPELAGRADVPYRMLAYDFDVCGQVINNVASDFAAAEAEALRRDPQFDRPYNVGVCLGAKAEQDVEVKEAQKHDVSAEVRDRTASAFDVERIRVLVGGLRAQLVRRPGGGVTVSGSLDYEVTGIKPALDGVSPVRAWDLADAGWDGPRVPDLLVGAAGDSRMVAVPGGGPIALGTSSVPILQHCSQVFLDDPGMSVPVGRGGPEYSGEEERFGQSLLRELKRNVRRDVLRTSRTNFSGRIEFSGFVKKDSVEQGALTIGCVIHVQGMRPIVMAAQIGNPVDLSYSPLRRGAGASDSVN